MEEIGNALLTLHSPSTPREVRLQAQSYVDALKASDNVQHVMDTAHALVLVSDAAAPAVAVVQRPLAQHFGLHLYEHLIRARWLPVSSDEEAQRSGALSEAQRASVRGTLVSAVRVYAEHGAERFIREKLAAVVTEIALRDWPQRWPSLVDELLSSAADGGGARSAQAARDAIVAAAFKALSEDVTSVGIAGAGSGGGGGGGGAKYEMSARRRSELSQALHASLERILAFLCGAAERALGAGDRDGAATLFSALTAFAEWAPCDMLFDAGIPNACCGLVVAASTAAATAAERSRSAGAVDDSVALSCLSAMVCRRDARAKHAERRFAELFAPLTDAATRSLKALDDAAAIDVDEYDRVKRLVLLVSELGGNYFSACPVRQQYLEFELVVLAHPSLKTALQSTPFWSVALRHDAQRLVEDDDAMVWPRLLDVLAFRLVDLGNPDEDDFCADDGGGGGDRQQPRHMAAQRAYAALDFDSGGEFVRARQLMKSHVASFASVFGERFPHAGVRWACARVCEALQNVSAWYHRAPVAPYAGMYSEFCADRALDFGELPLVASIPPRRSPLVLAADAGTIVCDAVIQGALVRRLGRKRMSMATSDAASAAAGASGAGEAKDDAVVGERELAALRHAMDTLNGVAFRSKRGSDGGGGEAESPMQHALLVRMVNAVDAVVPALARDDACLGGTLQFAFTMLHHDAGDGDDMSVSAAESAEIQSCFLLVHLLSAAETAAISPLVPTIIEYAERMLESGALSSMAQCHLYEGLAVATRAFPSHDDKVRFLDQMLATPAQQLAQLAAAHRFADSFDGFVRLLIGGTGGAGADDDDAEVGEAARARLYHLLYLMDSTGGERVEVEVLADTDAFRDVLVRLLPPLLRSVHAVHTCKLGAPPPGYEALSYPTERELAFWLSEDDESNLYERFGVARPPQRVIDLQMWLKRVRVVGYSLVRSLLRAGIRFGAPALQQLLGDFGDFDAIYAHQVVHGVLQPLFYYDDAEEEAEAGGEAAGDRFAVVARAVETLLQRTDEMFAALRNKADAASRQRDDDGVASASSESAAESLQEVIADQGPPMLARSLVDAVVRLADEHHHRRRHYQLQRQHAQQSPPLQPGGPERLSRFLRQPVLLAALTRALRWNDAVAVRRAAVFYQRRVERLFQLERQTQQHCDPTQRVFSEHCRRELLPACLHCLGAAEMSDTHDLLLRVCVSILHRCEGGGDVLLGAVTPQHHADVYRLMDAVASDSVSDKEKRTHLKRFLQRSAGVLTGDDVLRASRPHVPNLPDGEWLSREWRPRRRSGQSVLDRGEHGGGGEDGDSGGSGGGIALFDEA